MRYRATPDFWYHYRQLPDEIQDLADRCYELLKQDSKYPSLHFKKVGQFWSVRIGIHYLLAPGNTVEAPGTTTLRWSRRKPLARRRDLSGVRGSTSLLGRLIRVLFPFSVLFAQSEKLTVVELGS